MCNPSELTQPFQFGLARNVMVTLQQRAQQFNANLFTLDEVVKWRLV